MKNRMRWLMVATASALAVSCGTSNPIADGGSNTGDAGSDASVDAGNDAGGDAGFMVGPNSRIRVLADGSIAPIAVGEKLSEMRLFKATPIVNGVMQPEVDLVDYHLSTILFSDDAIKSRSFVVPRGAAKYSEEEVLDFPVGTIFTKSFAFPADFREPEKNLRVIETRLFIHQPTGWEPYPFIWNDAGTEATWSPGGEAIPISFIAPDGGAVSFTYLVPSRNQCIECHHLTSDAGDVAVLIGPKARYLNWVADAGSGNQLEAFAAQGLLTGLPAASNRPRAIDAFNPDSGSLGERARTYLDINCAHCHRPNATAGITSALWLNWGNQNTFNYGYCKRPGSAGAGLSGTFDIQPGDHTMSILWDRMQTTLVGKLMPQIGRALRHDQAADVVAAWIDSLPETDCK